MAIEKPINESWGMIQTVEGEVYAGRFIGADQYSVGIAAPVPAINEDGAEVEGEDFFKVSIPSSRISSIAECEEPDARLAAKYNLPWLWESAVRGSRRQAARSRKIEEERKRAEAEAEAEERGRVVERAYEEAEEEEAILSGRLHITDSGQEYLAELQAEVSDEVAADLATKGRSDPFPPDDIPF
jgi:hypothetical protein